MNPLRKTLLRAGTASIVLLCAAAAGWAILLIMRAPVSTPAEIFIPSGHVRFVSGVSWSPDAQWVATASWDGTVRVLNARSGRVVRTLRDHRGRVNGVAWDPSGARLLSAGEDGTMHVWNSLDGSLSASFKAGAPVRSVAWSLDGASAAGALADGFVAVWRPETDQASLRFQAHSGPVRSVALHPAGRLLVTAGEDRTVRVWDATSGEPASDPLSHPHVVTSVSWDPSGQHFATSCWDGQVRVWTASGQSVRSIAAHTHVVTQAAWSPDGSELATAGLDRAVRIWTGSGEMRLELKEQRAPLTSVAWSPDGTRLASGAEDHSVFLWSAGSGEVVARAQGAPQLVTAAVWSPDGSYFATAGRDSVVRVWDASSGALVHSLANQRGTVTSVAWSPDGRTVAAAGFNNSVYLYETATGRFVGSFRAHADAIFALAFARSGRFATASGDGSVKVWNAETLALVRELPAANRGSVAVAWNPDGSLLAEAGDDRLIRVWGEFDTAPIRVLAGHTGSITSLAFSPDGMLLASASLDRTVRLWNAATGAEVSVYRDHERSVMAVAWAPSGRSLATSGLDGAVIVRDTASGEARVLKGHGSEFMSCAWSPDGSRIAGASREGMVDFWDAAGGEHRFVLAFLPGSEWLLYDVGRLHYAASESGGEAAYVRFGRLPEPLYPLAYYRGELQRVNVLTGNGESARPAPAPVRMAWDAIPAKPAWFLGLFGVYGLAGGVGFWVTRGGNRLAGMGDFFVQAGFRTARVVDGSVLRLAPPESELPGFAAAWEPGESSVIESVLRAWTALQKSAGDAAPSSFRCYLLTEDPRGTRAEIRRVRQEIPGIVIPLNPLSVRRAMAAGTAKPSLRIWERPYPALADPYADLGPVTDPAWFFGRDGLLTSLNAATSAGRHVLLRGWRKSGRTSLARQLLSVPDRPCAWVDARQVEGSVTAAVLAAIGRELEARKIARGPGSGSDFETRFRKLSRAFVAAGGSGPIVVVLDDADRVLPEIAPLLGIQDLTVVAVAFRASADGFSELPVHPLDPVGLTEMIAECGRWKDIQWTHEANARIAAASGGDLAIARFLASAASKEGFRKVVDETMVERAITETIETIEKNRAGQYFRTHLWEPATEAERHALVRTAKTKESAGEPSLERFGLTRNGSVRCPVFEAWLRTR